MGSRDHAGGKLWLIISGQLLQARTILGQYCPVLAGYDRGHPGDLGTGVPSCSLGVFADPDSPNCRGLLPASTELLIYQPTLQAAGLYFISHRGSGRRVLQDTGEGQQARHFPSVWGHLLPLAFPITPSAYSWPAL